MEIFFCSESLLEIDQSDHLNWQKMFTLYLNVQEHFIQFL